MSLQVKCAAFLIYAFEHNQKTAAVSSNPQHWQNRLHLSPVLNQYTGSRRTRRFQHSTFLQRQDLEKRNVVLGAAFMRACPLSCHETVDTLRQAPCRHTEPLPSTQDPHLAAPCCILVSWGRGYGGSRSDGAPFQREARGARGRLSQLLGAPRTEHCPLLAVLVGVGGRPGLTPAGPLRALCHTSYRAPGSQVPR